MSLSNDIQTLWHLLARRAHGRTHAERLDSFYSGQASGYDSFRKRMLHGRDEMFQAIPVPPGGVWVDLGAGTGENAERIGAALGSLSRLYLVDLSSALLKQAQERVAARGWQNVRPIFHDATTFVPEEGQADVVTFSYSLTMIPDWFKAIDQAAAILKPGGVIGVVDFYVARKHPVAEAARHGWTTRTLWPAWFGVDNVFLSPDHLPYLQHRFETIQLHERRGKLPYMPGVRAPHYLFLGRRPEAGSGKRT